MENVIVLAPFRKHGPILRYTEDQTLSSQGDVYQMMACAHLYKAPRLTLLYPHHENLSAEEGVQAQFRISGQETIIETASVDVASGDNMTARLRNIIALATDDALV